METDSMLFAMLHGIVVLSIIKVIKHTVLGWNIYIIRSASWK